MNSDQNLKSSIMINPWIQRFGPGSGPIPIMNPIMNINIKKEAQQMVRIKQEPLSSMNFEKVVVKSEPKDKLSVSSEKMNTTTAVSRLDDYSELYMGKKRIAHDANKPRIIGTHNGTLKLLPANYFGGTMKVVARGTVRNEQPYPRPKVNNRISCSSYGKIRGIVPTPPPPIRRPVRNTATKSVKSAIAKSKPKLDHTKLALELSGELRTLKNKVARFEEKYTQTKPGECARIAIIIKRYAGEKHKILASTEYVPLKNSFMMCKYGEFKNVVGSHGLIDEGFSASELSDDSSPSSSSGSSDSDSDFVP